MARRFGLSAVVLFVLLTVVSTGASSPARTTVAPAAEANAYAVQVIVPGAVGASAGRVSAPPNRAATGPGFAFGESTVVTAGFSSSSFADTRPSAANAASDVNGVSLFGGEVTAASVVVRARSGATPKASWGELSGSTVTDVQALGQPVAPTPGTSVPLADWGTLTVLTQTRTPTRTSRMPGFRAAVIGLHVHLTADRAGLPAGTDVFVGYAETTVQAGTPPVDPIAPATPDLDATRTTPPVKAREPGRRGRAPGLSVREPRRAPPTVQPKLTAGGYVFPVYGKTAWGDTFGGARAAPVGWHHGADIFAPIGAPILAVADGTLFSVGWNDIGGLRLWLRDRDGNEFYYAHLSAFATTAIDGAQVRAGQVIGFVGRTGDAEGTPPHLHFEIHPVSMLYLGYDGAVNPTKYLLAWQKLEDVPIEGVIGWAPLFATGGSAPKPGAILLEVSDISSASGLDPGSLRRALRGRAPAIADGALAPLR